MLDRICAEVADVLEPDGELLLVQSALSDPELTVGQLRAAEMKASVTRRQRIAFGPVLRSREEWLRRQVPPARW